MKKFLRILAVFILVVLVLAIAGRLLLPWAAVEIANRKLPGILRTEASVGGLSLGLLRGYVSIRDLRIAQPEGFGEGDILVIPAIRLKVKLASLFRPPLTVEEVVLSNWEVNLVKNREGAMNLNALLPPPAAEPESEEPQGEPAKPILVRLFSIENLTLSYTDYAITAPPAAAAGDEAGEVLRVKIAALNFRVKNLLLDPAADPAAVEPGSAVLTARIVQEPFSDGLLGLAARIGPVGGGLPPLNLNAVLRLADLELQPLSAVVPGGVSQVLGGSALDLSADLALASYLLDCGIEVEVSGGHSIPLAIGGTPEKPEVDTSSLLFGVMVHLGGGVGRLVGNFGGAGYQLAAGAGETTWAVGKGVVNVAGSLGGGLFKTLTSAATGDLDGVVEGLSDTTVGTANTAAAAAGDVAGEVAEGASSTAETTTGGDADRLWRADSPRRWEESWTRARELLTEMPFPPPRRVEEPPGAPPERPSSGVPSEK